MNILVSSVSKAKLEKGGGTGVYIRRSLPAKIPGKKFKGVR